MTVTVTVDLHHAAINTFLYAPYGPVTRGVRRWSNQVREFAVARAPKATGALVASASVDMASRPGRVIGVITFSARHALWVHEGTGIYGRRGRPIVSRSGGVLKFRSGRRVSSRRRSGGSLGYTYTRTSRGQRAKPYLVWALKWVMIPKGARIKVFAVR